jgi:hypothetical protein
MAFWRRSRGRHARGGQARAAAPLAAPTPVAAQPVLPPAVPPLRSPATPAIPMDWSFPELAAPAPTLVTGPRAELTFRDGTSAALDPQQARALDEIAQVLTRRDEVKH